MLSGNFTRTHILICLYNLQRNAKGKMVVTGKGCLNLAKLASEREFQTEREIVLINLRAGEFRTEATLSVSQS